VVGAEQVVGVPLSEQVGAVAGDPVRRVRSTDHSPPRGSSTTALALGGDGSQLGPRVRAVHGNECLVASREGGAAAAM
jgi:hypothetical protein